ncbi:MAG TPA: hypothetical protein ACFYD2_10265 [Candidatus Avalokitesvara rifleensis]|uniref:hypothetical protein n=1 Tax=Candidatus Avalokitesvara rifleensis TaxID=3367620 RepID=UPI0040258C37
MLEVRIEDMKRRLFPTLALLCLLMFITSCDVSSYYSSSSKEETETEQGEVDTPKETQVSEGATDQELKDAMKSSAKYMKNLESAMEFGNWSSARASAKKLEDLIGQRCVNLYIKTYGSAPEEFVNISQDFYTHVLKLLIAEKYNNYDLARTHFEDMKADCEYCHSKFKKEKG